MTVVQCASSSTDSGYQDDVLPQPLLIFDCDGVLIDSELLACQAVANCVVAFGIAMTAEEIVDRYLGISLPAMLTDLEVHLGCTLPADFADTLRQRVAAAFEAELRPMPGIDAALQMLPHPRCVASSSAPERLRHSLRLTGLLPHFDPHIFSATQVARGKPAPDLFLFAAQRMQAPPAACVVIEDSVPGVLAATAACMRAIGFAGGSHCRPGHTERLRAAGASAVCDDMQGLGALL
jgi:HAD superfamily hydrolase (TIGR01509 family)